MKLSRSVQHAIVGVCLIAMFLIVLPIAASQDRGVLDLTATFADCGVDIEGLIVVHVSGIVLIRGTTNDAAKAVEASRVAAFLGYDRVSNLIRVVDAPAADALIERRGQRALDLEPMLQGCKFRVDSSLGVVQVSGRLKHDDQKFLAIAILLRVSGVKEVHWD